MKPHRRHPARTRTGLLLVLLGSLSGTLSARGGWECVPAPDGQGWSCRKAGAAATQQATAARPAARQPEIPVRKKEPPAPPQTKPRPPQPPATPKPPPATRTTEAPAPRPAESPAGASHRVTGDHPAPGPAESPREKQPGPQAQEAQSSPVAWFPSLDEGLQWENCRLPALPPQKIETPGGVLTGEADAVEAARGNGIALFRGHVVVTQPGSRILADRLDYDRNRQRISTRQPLFIEQPSLRLLAEGGEYYPDEGRGTLDDVEYRLLEPRARGTTEQARLLDREHSRFRQITFTTCPPGNEGFVVRAKEMEIDREQKAAYFRNARLDLLGVPIFYSPYLSIPLTDERRSGFLPPTVGFSSTNGFDLTVPYYFNLAPNYDATLLPRIISERGLLIGGEFRFLSPPHNGILRAEILPDDRKYNGNQPRGAFHAQTHSSLAPGLGASVDINWVSDDDYLRDLGQSLAVTSTSFLRNRVALDFHRRNWDLLAEVRHYRTLDQNIPARSRPYSLLPRLNVNWGLPQGPGDADYGFTGEFVHFYRDDSITGQRLDLQPRISLPLERAWGYLEPSATIRYTSYNLQNQVAGYSDTPDRFIYTLGVDGGLFFDRSTELFGRAATITLEPRLHYTYTPYRNQDELPLFDTGLLDFTFDNLFRGNRFNGPDRVGDANQVAAGLTSRLIRDEDGRELLRASIGQIYYFQDRRVRLDPRATPVDTSSSSVIAEVTTEIFRNWLLRAAVQVDPHNRERKLRQGLAQATWHGEGERRFHVSWRLREQLLEQTDVAAIWPVSRQVNLIGRWYYSVQESRTVEAVGGVEYNNCCWRFRTVVRRFLQGTSDTYNNSILFELELKGLGVLGHNIDKFLDREIYGY